MITIITVCYNAAKDIESTIRSVITQNTKDIEYIIKDGYSNDGTTEIVQKLKNEIEINVKHFLYISEKDTGLYNAMNIATQYATGERVIFLNAGDYFYKDNIVSTIIGGDYQEDIVYGDIVQKKDNLIKICESDRPIEDIKTGMIFNHQSAFIKTSVMKEYQYNEQYHLCADYEFFLRCYKNGNSFRHLNFPIAVFLVGGLSYIRSFDLVDEAYDIQCQYGCLDQKNMKKLRKKNAIRKKIRTIIPPGLHSILRKLKNRNSIHDWKELDS